MDKEEFEEILSEHIVEIVCRYENPLLLMREIQHLKDNGMSQFQIFIGLTECPELYEKKLIIYED